MRVFTIAALLLPLVFTFVNGAQIEDIGCQDFSAEQYTGTFESFGELIEDPSKAPNFVKSVVSRITRNGLFKRYYHYTVSAGILAAANGKAAQLFAQVERTDSQGLGTLFRIKYFDKNMGELKTIGIYPNKRCLMDIPWTKEDIGMITAAYRKGDS